MKKLMYMGLGILVGGTIVTIAYNTKPITMCVRNSKNSMLRTINDCMDSLAMLIEEMDEEKVKHRLKMKYNYFKRKIKKIDFDNLEENMKEKISDLINEIKELIQNTKEKELEE